MPEIDLSHWSSTQFEDPLRQPTVFEEVFHNALRRVECYRRRKWKWRRILAVDEAPVILGPHSDSAHELVEARR